MKYDDASWHHGGTFPTDVPQTHGATHIAFFAAWAALNMLGATPTDAQSKACFDRLRSRSVTPNEWFEAECDGKFLDEDLNDEGNAFAQAYYADNTHTYVSQRYAEEYARAFPNYPDVYRIPPTWESFDRIAPVIQRAHRCWLARNPQFKHSGLLALLWAFFRRPPRSRS